MLFINFKPQKETNEAIVLKTSHTLSKLIEVCVERVPCPNSKLIKNLTVTLTTNRSLYPTNEYIQSFFSSLYIKHTVKLNKSLKLKFR